MKLRYRLFRRSNGVFFCEDRDTRAQQAAETRTQHKLCGVDGAVKRLQRLGQPFSSDQ
jgi:hypothetical protein